MTYVGAWIDSSFLGYTGEKHPIVWSGHILLILHTLMDIGSFPLFGTDDDKYSVNTCRQVFLGRDGLLENVEFFLSQGSQTFCGTVQGLW
jgi:hypothetical protein